MKCGLTRALHQESNKYLQLEALGERRLPWPRHIIIPILPTVEMFSLGGERTTPNVVYHYLYHDLVIHTTVLWCFLLIYVS